MHKKSYRANEASFVWEKSNVNNYIVKQNKSSAEYISLHRNAARILFLKLFIGDVS